MRLDKRLLPIFAAGLITLPGFCLLLIHLPLPPPIAAVIAGLAIMGAAFLLLWATDAAQMDMSASLALALVALIAVSPEYAVDMYFTWMAGKHPAGEYAQYSIANMTGANRLLIGVAWTLIAVVFWLKTRRSVRIEQDRRTEVLFLGLATAYAFVIPLKGTLAWYDGIVFLTLYAWYMRVTSRRPAAEQEPHGPAEVLARLPATRRRMATWGLFAFAGAAILANAEAFSEGLIGTGSMLHVSRFVLVQWLAPIASEAPEFIVALMFVLRGKAGMALGSLLCAELNQWTLLVGMIPGAYALSHGSLDHPIPMGGLQMHEILLTAAQSLLAVVMLASLRLTVGQALLLLALFVGQLVTPSVIAATPWVFPWRMNGDEVHTLYTLMYLVAAAAIFLLRPGRVWRLRTGLRTAAARTLVGSGSRPGIGESPQTPPRRCAASARLTAEQRKGLCPTCGFFGKVCAGREPG